jgi:excisionase family DNA binding protein
MDTAQKLMKKRLLTTSEMARILNMVPRSVRQLVERNEIPFIRVNRWHLRFDPDAIDAWLKKRTGIAPQERAIWEGRRKALAERQAQVLGGKA